jgi:hypothetical protein
VTDGGKFFKSLVAKTRLVPSKRNQDGEVCRMSGWPVVGSEM